MLPLATESYEYCTVHLLTFELLGPAYCFGCQTTKDLLMGK